MFVIISYGETVPRTYTHEIFKRVRIEFSGRQGCILKELVRGGDEVKYKIEDEACSGKLF